MIKRPDTNAQRIKRHKRVRAKVSGTPARPRLNVFRSEKNIYAQIIDDVAGHTLVAASSLDKEIDNKVLFVIMTDGMENSSIEFSKSQISNMINNHNWEFIFIGADIDSYSEAGNIGIRKSRTANYRKSKQGVEDAYCSIECVTNAMRADMDLDKVDWKANLRKYD